MAIIRAKQNLTVGAGRIEALLYLLQTLKVLAITTTEVSEIVITSLNDSKHSKNSKHYKNQAVDIRSKNFPTRESKRKFREEYEKLLGSQFRVLLEGEGTENEHFHAQVRKGLEFP